MALGDAVQPPTVRSHGVVLDAYAFIKGWLIATSLWVGVLLLLVAAGYGVPATLVFWLLGSVLGLGWQPWLLIPWATVGAAAAIARWAIRNDVLASNSAADPT